MTIGILKRDGSLSGSVVSPSGLSGNVVGVASAIKIKLGRSLLGAFGGTLKQWVERSRQRHALAALDDRLLSDLGISRALANEEFHKPFWRG